MGAQWSDLTIMKNLGSGSVGSVDLIATKDGRVMAMKTISKQNKKFKASSVKREIKAGQKIKHKGVGAVRTSYEDKENVYLFMDYISGKDLVSVMKERNGIPMEEKAIREIFEQLLDTIDHIHSKGIAHRDIKLANIMLEPNGTVKVVDFGLCETTWAGRCKEHVGSLDYAAPEVFGTKAYNGYSADIWSMGCLLYALFCGALPFTKTQLQQMQTSKCIFPTFPARSNVSDQAKDLISQMLKVDPLERISLKNIILHEWLAY